MEEPKKNTSESAQTMDISGNEPSPRTQNTITGKGTSPESDSDTPLSDSPGEYRHFFISNVVNNFKEMSQLEIKKRILSLINNPDDVESKKALQQFHFPVFKDLRVVSSRSRSTRRTSICPSGLSDGSEGALERCWREEDIFRLDRNYAKSVDASGEGNQRHQMIGDIFADAYACQYKAETVHLAVSCMDRYLSKLKVTSPKELWQVQFALSFMAQKYNEPTWKTLLELYHLRDNNWNIENLQDNHCSEIEKSDPNDLIRKDIELFVSLDYEVGIPTVITFISMYIRRASADGTNLTGLYYLCEYLADLSLFSPSMVLYRPSFWAAGIFYYSLLLMGLQCAKMVEHFSSYTGIRTGQLIGIVSDIYCIHCQKWTVLGKYPFLLRVYLQRKKLEYLAIESCPLQSFPPECFTEGTKFGLDLKTRKLPRSKMMDIGEEN